MQAVATPDLKKELTMKTRLFAARNLFTCAAMFVLLLVGVVTKAGAAPAAAPAPTPPPDCHMNNPGDAEGLLTLLLNGSPARCIYDWSVQIDPSFRAWPVGSMNKPVVTAALGLFKS